MNLGCPVALLLFVGSISPEPACADPALFTIDPVKSALVAVGRHGGFLGFGAHEHAIFPSRWHIALRIDRRNLKASGVEISVPIESLQLDTEEARRVAGLEDAPPRGEERPRLDSQLRGFLDIRFSSEEILLPGKNGGGEPVPLEGKRELSVRGKLKLHGLREQVARDATVPVLIEPAENGTFRFSGRFRFRQRDFGIRVVPGDELEVRFDILTEPETVVASAALTRSEPMP
ncbi:MAG: YceI family protein [Oligoflexia bacterium]|nr:YceI family protein [Oligoflexia bacterium]